MPAPWKTTLSDTSTSGAPTSRTRLGRIELRLTLAVVIMAVLPLIIGVVLAARLARNASALFYHPHVGDELETSLGVYRVLVRSLKEDMKHRADAIAASEPLRAAVAILDAVEVQIELRAAFERYTDVADVVHGDPPLIELIALDVYVDMPLDACLEQFALGPPAGSEPARAERPPQDSSAQEFRRIGRVERPRADPHRDYVLVQCKPLGPDPDHTAMLVATFATDRARIDHLQEAADFLAVYRELEHRRDEWVRLNVGFFSALLGGTILVAAGAAFVFARSVSRRVSRVADAAGKVAGGDLDVHIPEEGGDEVQDLAAAFNRMVREVERNRARIEYLQRIGAWQDMARRLAHEIKNPLTPIQLAVEECHHSYRGEDEKMRALLDTTLEIVTEEVGTLRRLVSEFSDFARLPRADLRPSGLRVFLQEVQAPLENLGRGTDGDAVAHLTPSGGLPLPVRVKVDIDVAGRAADSMPSGGIAEGNPLELSIAVDRQMLRKALDNLVRNAVQAIRGAGKGYQVRVHASQVEDDRIAVDVDDDGPGVPPESRARVFDPYFTTRTEGTGLGLAIVKKIVLEHGGTITCEQAPTGGARFRMVLPAGPRP